MVSVKYLGKFTHYKEAHLLSGLFRSEKLRPTKMRFLRCCCCCFTTEHCWLQHSAVPVMKSWERQSQELQKEAGSMTASKEATVTPLVLAKLHEVFPRSNLT